jgi:RNA polymerase sigma factor (sigma-70 family)
LHSDQKYIDALVTHDQKLISEIYTRYAGNMKAYLLSRDCDEEDAGDVFQEALIDIYKLAHDKQFVLTCPFEAFLLLLCKRKYLNRTKKTSLRVVTNEDDDVSARVEGDANTGAELHTAQVEKEQLMMSVLEQLGNCKEVILKSLLKKPQEEIAEELGMSYAYYRKRKSNCMGELTGLVQQHPKYKELMP